MGSTQGKESGEVKNASSTSLGAPKPHSLLSPEETSKVQSIYSTVKKDVGEIGNDGCEWGTAMAKVLDLPVMDSNAIAAILGYEEMVPTMETFVDSIARASRGPTSDARRILFRAAGKGSDEELGAMFSLLYHASNGFHSKPSSKILQEKIASSSAAAFSQRSIWATRKLRVQPYDATTHPTTWMACGSASRKTFQITLYICHYLLRF